MYQRCIYSRKPHATGESSPSVDIQERNMPHAHNLAAIEDISRSRHEEINKHRSQ